MQYETISLVTDARGVSTLTLDRADKHNAMSERMIDELTHAASTIAHDDNIRLVILTGSGKSFCAGGDLGWMQDQMQMDRAGRMEGARKLANMLGTLNRLPKPLIGRIQGQAFGGGIGLMSICDVAIVADHAKFGLTETRLGLIPATISPYVVARMGQANARRVFMSARIFDAPEACALGLAAKAVPSSELDAAIEVELLPYLQTAPEAVAAAKELIRMLGHDIDAATIEATAEQLADIWEKDCAKEGIQAFFEKRRPNWDQDRNATKYNS